MLLQSHGIASFPHPRDVISGLRQGSNRVVHSPDPPETPLPPNFPDGDRYLAYLAVAAGATLVTEDEGALAAAASGDWGFEAIKIAEALQRARLRA